MFTKEKIGTWNDVKDILNKLLNQDFQESTYRKKYSAFVKMLEANQSKFVDTDSQLEEIRLERELLKEERIKLQTLNVERARIDRQDARQKLYYEYVGDICNKLPLPTFEKLYTVNTNKEYVLTISDIHYGADFVSENNVYNKEEAKRRFNRLYNETVEFVKNKELNNIKIVSLGDSLQGLLRLSDLKLNDSAVVKATVEISHLLATFLNDLSKYVNIEYYHCPTANHTQTRPLGTKASEISDEDLEYVISHYTKDLCANNERIKVYLAEEGKQYVKVNIFDYEVLAMHGHQIKNIDNSLKDLSMLRRRFIDFLLLGHFHNGKEIPSGEANCMDTEILISPSFVGSDPYSDHIMKGAKSSVKIYGFDEKYGHNETYKIVLN